MICHPPMIAMDIDRLHQYLDDHERAAAWLEAAGEGEWGSYLLPVSPAEGVLDGDWRPLARAVLADRKAGVPGGVIAARFHEAVIGWAAAIAALHPGLPVVLGGGCFLNARLVEGLLARLSGREVYPAGALPPGDGGKKRPCERR